MKSRNIYLCGFMGCGKSHIGRLLSEKTKMPLIDLDEYIVEKLGMTIPEIFSRFGEKHFRDAETKAIAEMAGKNAIIATGGGALLSEENSDIAKKDGKIVFIDTDFAVCYLRIKGDKNRPIVQRSTENELNELFLKRRKMYQKNSDFSADGNLTDTAIAEEILRKIF